MLSCIANLKWQAKAIIGLAIGTAIILPVALRIEEATRQDVLIHNLAGYDVLNLNDTLPSNLSISDCVDMHNMTLQEVLVVEYVNLESNNTNTRKCGKITPETRCLPLAEILAGSNDNEPLVYTSSMNKINWNLNCTVASILI